jgi:hypothetical protein
MPAAATPESRKKEYQQMAIVQELRERRRSRSVDAAEVWRRAAAIIVEGGELAEAEVEAIEQAAEVLGVDDSAEAFASDCEVLRQVRETERMIAAFDREAMNLDRAETGAEIRRLEREVLPQLKKRANRLEAESLGHSTTVGELDRIRTQNPRLFEREEV